MTSKVFGLIALTLVFTNAAFAGDRVTDSAQVATSTVPMVIPVPKPYGIGVEIIPAHLVNLVTEAYEAARDTLTADVAESGVAFASEAQPAATRRPAPRELSFEITPEIRTYLTYFTAGRGRGVAIRGVFRSEQYRADAERIFREEGVPTDLIWLAQVESAWQPTAVSAAGACGIWQFIPATGKRFGMNCTGDEADERMDFEKSTRGAARYLRWLNERYDGNWPLAIGAYNCGEGGMDRAIARAGGVEDFWVISRAGLLPTETANYVPAVLAASIFGTDPARYALDGRYAVDMQISSDAQIAKK